MGTTAEKLAYLKETKNQIKQALETPSNVMRDYANQIKKYVDNQPTSKVSDGVCTNALDVPLVSLGVDGNSEQKSTDGRNILNFSDENLFVKKNNISYVILDDGIRLKATNNDESVTRYLGILFTVEPNTDYTMKLNKTIIKNSGINIGNSYVAIKNPSAAWIDGAITSATGNISLNFNSGELETIELWLYLDAKAETVENLIIEYKDIIITSSSNTDYEPYTGGQPSPNPEYPQDIEVIDGVNLFDANAIPNNTNIVVEDNGKTIKMPIVTSGNGAVNTNKKLSELCPNLNVGDTAYLYFDRNKSIDGENEVIYLRECTTYWKIGTSVIITQEMLNSNVLMYGNRYISGETDQIILTNFQITKGTTPKLYLPQGCIGLEQSGKNKFDKNNVDKNWINNKIKNDSGTEINDETSQYSSYYMEVKPNTSYKVSLIPFAANAIQRIYYYTKNKTWINRSLVLGDINYIFTTPNDCYYIQVQKYNSSYVNVSNIQLEEGSTATDYESYHSPKLYPINLNGNSLAKVGDVKDLLKVYRNGDVEIKKKIGKYILNPNDWILRNTSDNGTYTYSMKVPLEYKIISNPSIISNKFINLGVASSVAIMYKTFLDKVGISLYYDATTPTTRAVYINSNITIDNLEGTEVHYELAEPETIKLPSISPIELWEGTNKFELITNLDTTFEMEYVVNKDYLETQNLLNIVEGENI